MTCKSTGKGPDSSEQVEGQANGSTDKLFGIIQQKFGETKEVIKRQIDVLHL